MIYLKDLGSYHDKATRIERLAAVVAGWLAKGDANVAKSASRAALLAKADLTTTMVGEFPSLQGTMGGIYATKTGESADVAKGIEEHYLPRSTADIDSGTTPKSVVGACVAIADRADSLAACFGMGLVPKGNQDPYARFVERRWESSPS